MTSESRTIGDHALQTQNQGGTADSFRDLMAAVIDRALADLERRGLAANIGGHVRDEAMAWINSPDCEAFCHALDMDYTAIREQAAALRRRFLEREEGREKLRRRPRTVRGLAS